MRSAGRLGVLAIALLGAVICDQLAENPHRALVHPLFAQQPSPAEAPAGAPSGAAGLPLPRESYPLRQGRALFLYYCATCHGEEGRGDGFNAYNLEPKPRDLGDRAFQAQRLDEDLAALIRIGGGAAGLSTAMPPWGRVLNPRQIGQLVAYLRTLQPKEENEEPESDGGEVGSRSQ